MIADTEKNLDKIIFTTNKLTNVLNSEGRDLKLKVVKNNY